MKESVSQRGGKHLCRQILTLNLSQCLLFRTKCKSPTSNRSSCCSISIYFNSFTVACWRIIAIAVSLSILSNRFQLTGLVELDENFRHFEQKRFLFVRSGIFTHLYIEQVYISSLYCKVVTSVSELNSAMSIYQIVQLGFCNPVA